MFNKKLKEQIRLVSSDIFEFHRWFANIKTDLKRANVHIGMLDEEIMELKTPKSGQNWEIEYNGKVFIAYTSYHKDGVRFNCWDSQPDAPIKSLSQAEVKPLRQV